MERQCVLPAVSDIAALRAFKILRTRVLRRLDMHKWNSHRGVRHVGGRGQDA